MSDATLISDATTTTAAAPATAATTTTTAPAAAAPVAATQQTPPVEATDVAKPGDAASTPVRAAPENYEFTLPEGMKVDDEIRGAFEAEAKELKMPQEEAQALMSKLAPKIQARVAQQQVEAMERLSGEWTASSMADKEFGGDKLTENMALGEKALSAFGTPELRQMLINSKLGNHPEIIRFMVRAGKQLSEDKFVAGAPVPPQKSDLEIRYPTMFKG